MLLAYEYPPGYPPPGRVSARAKSTIVVAEAWLIPNDILTQILSNHHLDETRVYRCTCVSLRFIYDNRRVAQEGFRRHLWKTAHELDLSRSAPEGRFRDGGTEAILYSCTLAIWRNPLLLPDVLGMKLCAYDYPRK